MATVVCVLEFLIVTTYQHPKTNRKFSTFTGTMTLRAPHRAKEKKEKSSYL